jgi:hypothetical protein
LWAGTFHSSTKPLPVFTVHSKMKRVRRKDLMDWLDGPVEASRP